MFPLGKMKTAHDDEKAAMWSESKMLTKDRVSRCVEHSENLLDSSIASSWKGLQHNAQGGSSLDLGHLTT